MDKSDEIFNTSVFDERGIEYRKASCDQPTDVCLVFDFGQNVIKLSCADAVIPDEGDICVFGLVHHNDLQLKGDVPLTKAFSYYVLIEQTIFMAQASTSNDSNTISACLRSV